MKVKEIIPYKNTSILLISKKLYIEYINNHDIWIKFPQWCDEKIEELEEISWHQ